MSWIRIRDRRTAQRIAVVDGYRFSAGVRYRFSLVHGELSLVAEASRQWFRLAARHPRAELSMPSVVVDDLWREMVRDTRDYSSFCGAAFGRPFPRPPAPEADRPARLVTTLRLAQEDEGCPPEALPLLFRIDRELGVKGGGHYLADCGGRDDCHELPGATCLRHITGTRGGRRWPGRLLQPPGGDLGGGGFVA
jgi:hypothetical protein